MTPEIATLTMNPSIDVGLEIDRVLPTTKLRSHSELYEPGGGGLNVARIFNRFGGRAHCTFLSGGATGATLEKLLERFGLEHNPVPIAGDTRICCNVAEIETRQDFRFIPPGPMISESEWRACLAALGGAQGSYFVASGSLPRGVPTDFYARVAEIARSRNMRMVLDSSNEALRQGLNSGTLPARSSRRATRSFARRCRLSNADTPSWSQ